MKIDFISAVFKFVLSKIFIKRVFVNYMIWIDTIIWVFILRQTYNYTSSYTIIKSMWYVQLFECLHLGVTTFIWVGIIIISSSIFE